MGSHSPDKGIASAITSPSSGSFSEAGHGVGVVLVCLGCLDRRDDYTQDERGGLTLLKHAESSLSEIKSGEEEYV